MATKTIYFNIEDDVKSIVARLRQEPGKDFILVFPRRCYLFSDAVNLKLLRKQLGILKKDASVMTMDERGQVAATDAGFSLVSVPFRQAGRNMSDVARVSTSREEVAYAPVEEVFAEVEKPIPSSTHKQLKKSIPRVATKDTFFADISHDNHFAGSVIQARESKFQRRRTMFVGAVVLVIIVAILSSVYVLPRATVVIIPKAEVINRDLEISISTATKQSDSNTLSLPGFAIDETIPKENKLNVLGKRELGSKATGTVRIINLTGTPINLKASTTVLTSTGKEYVFKTDQNYIKPISPKTVSAPDAGQKAELVATQGGETSNLPAGSKLEISNKVFGNKPNLLYAVVEDPLIGGNSRFISVVSEEDLSKAKEALINEAVADVVSELKGQGQILAEQTYNTEVLDFTSSKAVGDESTTLTAQAKVHIKGIAFDASSLTELVRNRVTQILPSGNVLQPSGKDTMNYKVRTIDINAGLLKIIVHFESKLYTSLDLSTIGPSLVGKSKTSALEKLDSLQGVEGGEITLWPAWQNTMPHFSSKIKVSEQSN